MYNKITFQSHSSSKMQEFKWKILTLKSPFWPSQAKLFLETKKEEKNTVLLFVSVGETRDNNREIPRATPSKIGEAREEKKSASEADEGGEGRWRWNLISHEEAQRATERMHNSAKVRPVDFQIRWIAAEIKEEKRKPCRDFPFPFSFFLSLSLSFLNHSIPRALEVVCGGTDCPRN